MVEVYTTKPEGFHPEVEASGCYIESNGKLLLLRRTAPDNEKGKWSVPGGKIEKGESPHVAAIRELFEETGITLSHSLEQVGSLFIRNPRIAYVFHIFKTTLSTIPNVSLSDEHDDYAWLSKEEISMIPLMTGAKEVFLFYESQTRTVF